MQDIEQAKSLTMASLLTVNFWRVKPLSFNSISTGLLKKLSHLPVTKFQHTLNVKPAGIQSVLRTKGLFPVICRHVQTKGINVRDKKKLLPFEQQRLVEKDTLFYERPTKAPWNYLCCVGVTMCCVFFVWSYNSWHVVEEIQRLEGKRKVLTRNWLQKLTTDWTYFKYIASAWLVVMGRYLLSEHVHVYVVRTSEDGFTLWKDNVFTGVCLSTGEDVCL